MSTEQPGIVAGTLSSTHAVHRALASLDQAVVAIDPRGDVLYWNTEAERLYGYRAEEAIGRALSDLVVSPAVAAAAAAWRTRLLPGRSCTSDWPVRDKAGRSFVASVMATAVVDDHGETVALIGVCRDVSRRRRDETRARMLAAIVDNSRDAIVETDLLGVVVATNPAVEAASGYAQDELIGRDVAVLTGAGGASAAIEAVQSGTSDAVRTVKAQHRDGSTFDLTLIVSPAHDGALEAVGPAAPTGVAVLAHDRSDLHAPRQALTRQDAQLPESDVRYRAIVEQAQVGIWTGDRTGRTSFANQQLVDMLGVPMSAAYDAPIVDLVDPTGAAGMAAILGAGREPGDEQFEIAYLHPDASERQLRFTLSAPYAVGNLGWLATVTDVTDFRRAERELHHQRLHDDLTGLPNRTALQGRLDRAVVRRQHRGHGSIAVLSVDLDQFKLVNESHGHAAGDAVLIEVARRLAAAVGPDETVGRFGGDTFAVVCPESSDDAAGEVAGCLQQALAEPIDLDGQSVHLSACVGIALCPPNAAPELLRCAETAMYWAKAAAPGTVRTFDRARAAEGAARLALSNDLREALQRDTLALHYQPIVDLNDGRILGVEALVRWHHPTHGPMSHNALVAVAEAGGLAPALGRWALSRACCEADRLGASNPTPLQVTVNVSAAHLADPGLEEAVLTAMCGSRLADGGLVLELTETSVMGDPTQARELLHRLRALGVQIAIDDFGTGYSSMAHLSRLPVNTVKIDQSFVRRITTDPDSLAVTESIITLAHTMRLTVVAQGIENVQQLKLLRQLGCEAGQGFLFGPELALDAFAELVDSLRQARFFDAEPLPAPAAVGGSPTEPVRRSSPDPP